jgi:hypothetical protein
MVTKIRNSAARAACDAINAQFDLGSAGSGHLRLYSGVRPASVVTAITTQTLLVEFINPNPLFDPSVQVSGGAQASANLPPDANALATDVATWGRVFDRDNNAVADVDVTDTSGSGDVKLANTSLVLGVAVTIVSWVATHSE